VRKLQVSSNVNTASGQPSLLSHAHCAIKIARHHLRYTTVCYPVGVTMRSYGVLSLGRRAYGTRVNRP